MRKLHLPAVICGIVVVMVCVFWLGNQRSTTSIGLVNSEVLMEKYVMVEIEEPLKKELETLQAELDEKISGTSDLSDEERVAAIQELQDEYQAKLDNRKAALVNQKVEEVRKAVAEVAASEGIDTVIDNTYEMVLYGGVDLTEDVLAKLKS